MFRLLSAGGTFVAFDTETTGLSCESCRIIEIGAVKFSAAGVSERFNTLINPKQHIPSECTSIHHITDDMVRDKPEMKEILPAFINFLNDSIIVAHNAQFDLRFLRAECERNGFSPVKNDVIDTLQFARWAFPEQKHFKQTLLAEQFGLKIKEAHRAYDDAFICGNIFLHLIKCSAERQKFALA